MRFKKIAITLVLLSLIARSANSRPSKCVENPAIPFVPYCALVKDPGKFSGQLVRTEAVWEQMIHSESLTDRSCPGQSPSAVLWTIASFAEKSNRRGPLMKALGKILRNGGAARVRIMGTFQQPSPSLIGPSGQRFSMEIQCLFSVTALKEGEY
jgi:hypothetical protein